MQAWFSKARQHMSDPAVYARVVACALMVGLLVGLRHLAVFFITFFILERLFAFFGGILSGVAWSIAYPFRRLFANKESAVDAQETAAQKERYGAVLAILLFLLLVGGGLFFLGYFGLHRITLPAAQGSSIRNYFESLKRDIAHTFPAHLQWVVDAAWAWIQGILKQYTDQQTNHLEQLRTLGRVLVQLAAGLVVAIIYRLDHRRVWQLLKAKNENSVGGLLQKYFRFVGEAVLLTIQLQVIVALVNTVLTFPVLVLLGLPRVDVLLLVVFLCSLIPILGNFISGTVLIGVSLLYKGWPGALLFWGITLLLHKLETYYLNPRLGTRHVNLPMTLMVVSLILFEHFFGVLGVFLSFPCLYVTMKIRQDIKDAFPGPVESAI